MWKITLLIIGGGRGIRTPGGLPHSGFQDRRLSPLGHPSGYKSVPFYQVVANMLESIFITKKRWVREASLPERGHSTMSISRVSKKASFLRPPHMVQAQISAFTIRYILIDHVISSIRSKPNQFVILKSVNISEPISTPFPVQ